MLTQGVDGLRKIRCFHEQIIGVERGHREHADLGFGKRLQQGGQYTNSREGNWASHLEAAPIAFASDAVGDERLHADD